jgi:hypothetical protein
MMSLAASLFGSAATDCPENSPLPSTAASVNPRMMAGSLGKIIKVALPHIQQLF